MIEVGPLETGDRSAWEGLARGYKAFYRDWIPDEAYETTWRRLRHGSELYGLGARIDGRLIGIAHYFFHPTFWSGEACYLQDLFVDEAVRGRGAARALIEAVAAAARDHGATRYYWHTQEDNTRARALYDKVARFSGFIRYQYPLLRTRHHAESLESSSAWYCDPVTEEARPGAEERGVKWLTDAEVASWLSLVRLVTWLPWSIDQQLRRDSDLGMVEYQVLARLSNAPKRTMRMSSLADLANSSLSRLSHLFKRLEARGLVRREPDPTDGRFTNAILTEQGFQVLAAAAPGHVAHVRSLVIDVLTPEQLRRLGHAADRIVSRIDTSEIN